MKKTHLLLSTAVGLAFVIAGPAAMAVGKKHAPAGNAKAHQAVDFSKSKFKAPKHQQRHGKPNHLKPRMLVETWAAPSTAVALPAGTFTAEDTATTAKCLKSCDIVSMNTAEVLSYYSYNQVAICPIVDGYFTNGSCYFSGALNPKMSYKNETNQTNLTVASGTHTIQTYLYVTAPAYLGHYQNDYTLYQAHAPH
jgi:hypothetical protein